jgi:hypothetical protein
MTAQAAHIMIATRYLVMTAFNEFGDCINDAIGYLIR